MNNGCLPERKYTGNDPYNQNLCKYIDEFNLFLLANSDEDNDRICKDPVQFLADHRYEAAIIYQIVIEWAEEQLRTHSECCLFIIEGP